MPGTEDMTPADAWRPIESAPRDGTLVWLRLARGYELPATWMRGFETEAGECGAWCAWSENMIPPSWTDAVCWLINEAGERSDQPVGWLPAPPEGTDP